MASLFDLLRLAGIQTDSGVPDPWASVPIDALPPRGDGQPGIIVPPPAAPPPAAPAETAAALPNPWEAVIGQRAEAAAPAAASPVATGTVRAPSVASKAEPDYSPSLSDRIGGFIAGLGGDQTLAAYSARGDRNLTAKALRSAGIDEATIAAAVNDPAVMKQVLPGAFGDKFIQVAPGNVLLHKGPGGQVKEAFNNSEGQKPTSDQSNYYTYVKQEQAAGRVPKPFGTWLEDMKKAGAQSVVIGGEQAQSKKLGEFRADQEIAIRTDANKAFKELGTINAMRQAMADPRFHSGTGAEMFALPIKQAIASFGGDPNAAASMETFRALAAKSVLEDIGGSLGTGISNADRDFISSQASRLANTEAGNEALLTIKERMARRKIEIGKLQDRYIEMNGGVDSKFDAALRQWAEQNPLFGPDDKKLFSAPPPSASAQDVPEIRRFSQSQGKWFVKRGDKWFPE